MCRHHRLRRRLRRRRRDSCRGRFLMVHDGTDIMLSSVMAVLSPCDAGAVSPRWLCNSLPFPLVAVAGFVSYSSASLITRRSLRPRPLSSRPRRRPCRRPRDSCRCRRRRNGRLNCRIVCN